MMINLTKEEAQFLVALAAHSPTGSGSTGNHALLRNIEEKLNRRGITWDTKVNLPNLCYNFNE